MIQQYLYHGDHIQGHTHTHTHTHDMDNKSHR